MQKEKLIHVFFKNEILFVTSYLLQTAVIKVAKYSMISIGFNTDIQHQKCNKMREILRIENRHHQFSLICSVFKHCCLK